MFRGIQRPLRTMLDTTKVGEAIHSCVGAQARSGSGDSWRQQFRSQFRAMIIVVRTIFFD